MGETMPPRQRPGAVFVVLAALALPAVVRGQGANGLPSPDTIVKRAIDAAGGEEAFRRLGIVSVTVNTDETTQEGKQTSSESRDFFLAPGPAPGRIEIKDAKILSADNGKEGWAIINGKYDTRPQTKIMIKRLLRTNLFPLLMPFSLDWDEVAAVGVAEEKVGNVPVWRLTLNLTKTFFHSPQIGTTWLVDIDRRTYAVVQAQSPPTDLGRGIKADGMRITWAKPQVVRGLVLPGEQHIVGIGEGGVEKAHRRVDSITYEIVDPERAAMLFENPVPPDKRPSPEVGPRAAAPPKQ
jgi:hypothetical protein